MVLSYQLPKELCTLAFFSVESGVSFKDFHPGCFWAMPCLPNLPSMYPMSSVPCSWADCSLPLLYPSEELIGHFPCAHKGRVDEMEKCLSLVCIPKSSFSHIYVYVLLCLYQSHLLSKTWLTPDLFWKVPFHYFVNLLPLLCAWGPGVFMNVLPPRIYVHPWYPQRPEEGARSSEMWVTDSCEQPWRCWEPAWVLHKNSNWS